MFQLNAQLVSAVRGPEQKQRERCARWERETSRSCDSPLQMHNIFICYKQDTQEACSTWINALNSNRSRVHA